MKIKSTDQQVLETKDSTKVKTDKVESNNTSSFTDTVDLSQESLVMVEDVTSDVDKEIKTKSLREKVNEFESLVNSLDVNSVDIEAVNGILATVTSEVNQTNDDYENGEIDKETLSSMLHATLDKGIDGILSLTSGVDDQTTIAVTQSVVESAETTPDDPAATEDNSTLTALTSTKEAFNIEKTLDTINEIINVIDSASETDNVKKDIEELVEQIDPLKLGDGLKKAISGLEEIDYSKFAERLRKLQTNLANNSKIFGEEETKIGGNINSIGTGIKEPSDDLNISRRLMSSMSSGINNVLEKYKEVKNIMADLSQKSLTDSNA